MYGELGDTVVFVYVAISLLRHLAYIHLFSAVIPSDENRIS